MGCSGSKTAQASKPTEKTSATLLQEPPTKLEDAKPAEAAVTAKTESDHAAESEGVKTEEPADGAAAKKQEAPADVTAASTADAEARDKVPSLVQKVETGAKDPVPDATLRRYIEHVLCEEPSNKPEDAKLADTAANPQTVETGAKDPVADAMQEETTTAEGVEAVETKGDGAPANHSVIPEASISVVARAAAPTKQMGCLHYCVSAESQAEIVVQN